MNHNERCLQIDATASEIVLDDRTSPHIYVAADDTGQLLAVKVYSEASQGNSDDFIQFALNTNLESEGNMD